MMKLRSIAIASTVLVIFGAMLGYWNWFVRAPIPVSPSARFFIPDDQIKAVEIAAAAGNQDARRRLALHYEIALNGDPRGRPYWDTINKKAITE